jgi:hypothetical protein
VLPLDVVGVANHLPDLLVRLAKLDGMDRASSARSHPRQVDDFRSRFASKLRKAQNV